MIKRGDIAGIRYAVMLAGSQTKLAKVLGVSKNAVSKWVKQGHVPKDRVKQIYDIYKIPQARLCDPAYLEFVSSGDDDLS